jgi:HK97 family phage prohead protease
MPSNSFVSDAHFKELAKAESLSEDTGLYKGFDVEVKAENEAKRQLSFTISTASVDRMGDSIAVDGWDLTAYKKNPVVLWAHDMTGLPIGRAADISVEDGKLKSVAEFVPADISRFADAVYRLYQAKFLNAASVGFRPTKWAWTEDKDRKFGIDFEQQELLEYSAVPVPANADALIEARAAGVDVSPVVAWASDILRKHAPVDVKSIREFEDFLRDVGGFSRSEAKAVASHGWKALTTQREVEPEPEATTELLTLPTEDNAAEIKTLLADFRKTLTR